MEISLQELKIKPTSHDTLTLIGQSLAGTRSCIVIPELDLCFDIGVCFDIAVRQKHVFISHQHADHIGCLHLHAFSRRMLKMDNPIYYMPTEAIENFNVAHDAFKCMNRHENYESKPDWLSRQYKLEPIEHNKEYKLPKNMYFKSLPTIHGVPSQAYCIFKNTTKLKDEYKELSSQEIGKLCKSGEQVTNNTTLNLIAYTGDTVIEGVLQHNDLLNSRILIMECTYIHANNSDKNFVEEATKRGHIHEQHIIDNYKLFNNEFIVLTHISARYSKEELLEMQKRMDAVFTNTKVLIFDPRVLEKI